MKKNLLLTVLLLFVTISYGQTDKAWTLSKEQNIKKNKNVERESFPQEFKLMQLDISILRQALIGAPDRSLRSSKGVIISLPNAEGVLERFEVFEASNFEPELQAQFPEIRSYAGNGIDDKYARLRMSIDPRGIQTMVHRADKATEFMEPYSQDERIYSVYRSSRVKGKLPFTCSTPEQNLVLDLSNNEQISRSSSGELLTFRLALSCTGEYANYFGATSAAQVGLVNAQFNATMTRVNGIFETDLGIHMNIVASNNNVIYYNPATDPYSPSASMANWNTELQLALNTTLTGPATPRATNNAAYDVGHLFGADGGGGNAGCIGCVCVDGAASGTGSTKGRGITSPADAVPMGDFFDVDYVAHELGHQFGANHTFSSSSEGTGVNKEVGGGVTVMGYAGITAYNTHMNSIDIFHSASIAQVQANMVSKTCPTRVSIQAAPVVNAGANYSIPLSTPFMLTGSATGSGTLTYTWEQNNDAGASTGTSSPASVTKTTGPNFVCFPDSSSPIRYFPVMSSILAGSTTTAGVGVTMEALSSVARTLNFRLTARDNVAGQGQTNFADNIITVANKTALTVSYPATANTQVYAIGSTQTVTWTGATGASGHNTIAGGANVDISFSADNGVTWTLLLAGTPNDGSQAVTLPAGVSGGNCRFMVKANANIFFNIGKSFAVGNYTYQAQNVCTDYTFDLNAAITESSDTSYPATSLTITDSFTITDIKTYANITHPNIGQVNVLFWFPWSTGLNTGIWYNQTACTNANMDKWFDLAGSAANCTTVGGSPFLPYSGANFTGAIGQNSAGGWRIYFKDVVVDGSGGVLNTFKIQLCRSEQVAVLASESFGIEGFTLYPNPNNGAFNIQFNSTSSSEIKVNVHDMRGREIFNKSYQNNGLFNESLQLKNVQSGIYLVTVQDGSRKEVKKIVVE